MTETHDSPVKPGDVLAGKYKVERVLGVGGMGVVVAATHLQLHQTVALKFALASALQTKDSVERFLREARAAVKLKSEHVAKVLDVGTLESGAPFMVMEFLEGADLAQVVQAQGALPVQSAADYVLQSCEALAEAHSLGIVHRDLKPQNLFLTQSVGGAPLVKVLDFGISKMTSGGLESALTKTSTVMGSPLYMAPEQMRSSRSVDPRADIWALGVILYELLTGHVPFEAETMPELCLKVVQDPPRPMTELRADVPVELVAVIEKCLAKDPKGRFQNAAELASALEPFASDGSKVNASRARMVMSTMSTAGAMAHTPAAARTQQPSTTDAGLSGDRPANGKSKTPIYVGVAIAALALGGVGAAMALSKSAPTAATAPPAPTESTTATPAANPTTTATATTTAITTAITTATATTTATASASASETPSATASASATASPSATTRGIPTKVPLPVFTATATAQPTSTGDGIPRTRH